MDPPEDDSFDVLVQRVTRQRRASHPPASDLFTAHRDEMNRALDAFEREWVVPLMSQEARQRTQRRLSTPTLLFESFVEARPVRRPVPANVRTIHIEWLDEDDAPRAPSSVAPPRIEDVTSSTAPEVLNTAHHLSVCVVEMPTVVDSPRTPEAPSHTYQRNLCNPNAPVITDVSTDINDE